MSRNLVSANSTVTAPPSSRDLLARGKSRNFRHVNQEISRKELETKTSKGDQLQFDGVGGSGSSSNGPATRDGDGGGDFEDVDVKDPHVTRLFYLQLYSSVLKAEREAQEEIRRSLLFQQKALDYRRKERKKSERQKKKVTKQVLKPHPKVVKSRSWMDVTQRLLGGETKENANVTTSRYHRKQDSHYSSQSTLNSERERDVGESFHPHEANRQIHALNTVSAAETLPRLILNDPHAATMVRQNNPDHYFERQQYHNRTVVELNGAGLSAGHNNRPLTFARSTAAASALGTVDGGVTIVQGRTPARQNSENSSVRTIEPILNARMRNLSNFSFREKGRDDGDRFAVINGDGQPLEATDEADCCNAGEGIWRRGTLCSTVYFCVSSVALALVLFLLFNRPDAYAAFYETVYIADGDPGTRPKVGLCLSMPFSKENLASLSVPTQLASFLLFSLSPFFPRESVIGDQELLTELTAQYRRLLGRASRAGILAAADSWDSPGGGGGGGSGSQMRPLLRLLRTLSPRCPDVITACQVGSKRLMNGDECCRVMFNRVEYSLQGMCLVASDFAKTSAISEFPVKNPGFRSKLTVFVNTTATSGVRLDQRLIPWDVAAKLEGKSTGVVTAAFVDNLEELSYRNVRRDVAIQEGQTSIVNVLKRGVDNSAPGSTLFGKCAADPEDNEDLFGYGIHAQLAGCRSNVIQMVAERSVNCSLASLPRTKANLALPLCGPLEGLALMYILKEQGALVAYDQEMLSKFESGVRAECPAQCHFHYYQPVVVSSTPTTNSINPHLITSKGAKGGSGDDRSNGRLSGDTRLNSRLSNSVATGNGNDIAILEIRYRSDEFIRVRRYQSGTFQFLHRLGSVCGVALMLVAAAVVARSKLCSCCCLSRRGGRRKRTIRFDPGRRYTSA